MDYNKAKDYILERLQKELPAYLTYHSVDHVQDVLNATEQHIAALNVPEEDAVLLRTAALYHDSGFTIQADGHEELSCGIAKDVLPDYGYSPSQIARVCGMIMATKIPQSPTTPFEEILADADLDYLGRDDFFEISDGLFTELKNRSMMNDVDEWNKLQVRFFENHHYFTAQAKAWRDAKKQNHLETIKKKLL